MTAPPHISPWCQRWRHGQPTWRRRRDGGFDRRRYTVTPAPAAPLRDFCATHHYARTWPAAKMQFAMHDRVTGELVGAIVLAVPTNNACLTRPFPELEANTQTLLLSRLVLLDQVDSNAESWACRQAFGLACEMGLRALVTYADPTPRYRHTPAGPVLIKPGHYGTTYQASGAIYDGLTTARLVDVLPDGTVLPGRSASKLLAGHPGALGAAARLAAYPGVTAYRPGVDDPAEWLRQALTAAGATRQRDPGKHRYLIDLRTARQRRLDRRGYPAHRLARQVSLPYPKAAQTPAQLPLFA